MTPLIWQAFKNIYAIPYENIFVFSQLTLYLLLTIKCSKRIIRGITQGAWHRVHRVHTECLAQGTQGAWHTVHSPCGHPVCRADIKVEIMCEYATKVKSTIKTMEKEPTTSLRCLVNRRVGVKVGVYVAVAVAVAVDVGVTCHIHVGLC